MQAYASELATAIAAVHAASHLTARVQSALVPANDAIAKLDKSPVTVADFAAQAVVSYFLSQSACAQADPIVGEEESSALRADPTLANKVVAAIRQGTQHVPAAGKLNPDEWLDLIDRASGTRHSSSSSSALSGRRYWTLDPVDGTKGFLRHQQFAVCLALLENNQVQVGVLGCPNLPATANASGGAQSSQAGTLLWAVRGQGAWQMDLSHSPTDFLTHSTRISTAIPPHTFLAAGHLSSPIMLESYESSHSNHELSSSIAARLGITADPVRIDSQCKYAQVARGQGHLYLRILREVEYKERIWDHAAGSLIVTEAGGRVTDLVGQELKFKPTGALDENVGIVATGGGGGKEWHDKVLEAVKADPGFGPYLEAAKKVLLANKM